MSVWALTVRVPPGGPCMVTVFAVKAVCTVYCSVTVLYTVCLTPGMGGRVLLTSARAQHLLCVALAGAPGAH